MTQYIVAVDDYGGYVYLGEHDDLDAAKKDFEEKKKQRFEVVYLAKVVYCSHTPLTTS